MIILITIANIVMASNRITDNIEKAPERLGGKVPEASSVVDLLCSTCGLPLVEPQQTIDCGCRLYVQCYSVLKDR